MSVMKPLFKGLLAFTAALAFTARGAATFCPPKAEHDCCGKSIPAAPHPTCRERSCCRAAPATAAPASQSNDAAFSLPVSLAQPLDGSHVAPAFPNSGPPGQRVLSVSDRSPPPVG